MGEVRGEGRGEVAERYSYSRGCGFEPRPLHPFFKFFLYKYLFLYLCLCMIFFEICEVLLRRSPDPSVCFSIVGQKRTLDLECSNEQVRDFWMSRFYLLKILQHELQNSV